MSTDTVPVGGGLEESPGFGGAGVEPSPTLPSGAPCETSTRDDAQLLVAAITKVAAAVHRLENVIVPFAFS
jgi:hypothetical protein